MKEIVLIKNRQLFKIVSGQYEYWSKSKRCYLWGSCKNLINSNQDIVIHNLPANSKSFLKSLGYTVVSADKIICNNRK